MPLDRSWTRSRGAWRSARARRSSPTYMSKASTDWHKTGVDPAAGEQVRHQATRSSPRTCTPSTSSRQRSALRRPPSSRRLVHAGIDWFRTLHDHRDQSDDLLRSRSTGRASCSGLLVTVELSAICHRCLDRDRRRSAPGSRARGWRGRAGSSHGYIQFFRNTPPLVQLYFFYFGLERAAADDAERIGHADAADQRLRLGVHLAVASSPAPSTWRSSAPASRRCRRATIEAAEALGYTRLQAYMRDRAAAGAFGSACRRSTTIWSIWSRRPRSPTPIAVPELLYVVQPRSGRTTPTCRR